MRALLRAYSLLFLLCGLSFVFLEERCLALLSWAGALAGAPALAPGGPSLWLGLTGSLMAVIAFLAYRLSQDPEQPVAWEALLLSKAVSSSLFLNFTAGTLHPLFVASALVDGTIFLHLAYLRARQEGRSAALPVKLAAPMGPFYQVWFARLNDAASGRALWVRYSLLGRPGGQEASCWAIFFDPPANKVVSRKWSGRGELSYGALKAAGQGVSWDLRWDADACPAVAVVPAWLRALGLSRSGYVSVAPRAAFSGRAVLDGVTWEFDGAPGCVGHVWGRRYGKGWWWAHAIFDAGRDTESVFEILSAPGPLGRRLTSAFLWRGGKLYSASGPLDLLRTASNRQGDHWSFRAKFPGLDVEGGCSIGRHAVLEYEGPDGGKLTCRNSKVSPMRLTLSGGERAELRSTDAAVEFVEAVR